MSNVGYATLQVIPSVRGIAGEIRRQLAPAAAEGEHAGGESGRSFGEGFRHLLEAAGIMTGVEKLTESISEAFGEAVDQSGLAGRLKVQLGTTGPVAAQYGNIAGQLYAGAVTDSVETAAEDIRAVAGAGLLPPGATQAQITSITTQFADFTTSFEQDAGLTAQAVSAMVRNGLAKDAPAALDLLTRGFQKFGPRAEDLVETMQEYPVQLRKLGLDGKTTLGLLGQALRGGARDTDIAADALKEFSIRSIDGSATTIAGYKGLGLSATTMAAQIVKGGSSASAGLQTVLDRLRAVKDPVKQSQLAVDLFGTQAEDLGKALYSLDPKTAVKSIGDVGGAAARMGTDLRDNAGARLTMFSRSLKQGLVQVIGGQVLPRLLALGTTVQTKVGPPLTRIGGVLARNVGPAMDKTGRFITGTLVPALVASADWVDRNSGALEIAAGIVGTLLLPLFITLAVSYATAGAAAVVSGAQQVGTWIATGVSAVGSAGLQLVSSYRTVGGWILMGATSIASGARVVAGWVLSGLAAGAGAVASGLAVAQVVAGWILMGLTSLLSAARMAAAWLIALGPLGWVTVAVIAIVALIIANWSTVSRWTSQVWTAVSRRVMGAVNAVVGFVRANWPLLLALLTGPIGLAVYAIVHYWARISGGFSTAYRAVVGTGRALVGWVAGLPGRILGTLGGLGARLYGLATAAFDQLRSGAAARTGALLAAAHALPGRIKTALGNTGSLLLSAGKDTVRGLITGIESMGSTLTSKVSGFVKSHIPGPVRKVLDIGSPSRVMAELGRWAGQGLIDGLTGTSAQVSAASRKVADLVRRAFSESTADQIARDRKALAGLGKSKGDRIRAAALRRDIASQQRIARAGTGLARLVAADNARLAALARQRDGVAGKLKAAQDKLADITRSAADLRSQVAGGITSSAAITRDMGDGVPVTAASILDRLKGDAAAASTFAAQLLTLRRKGLSAGLVTQLAQAGVDGGEATAAALAAATPSQIKAINQQQKALATAAGKAGTVAADAMYGAGIRSAQGLVDGLKKQQSAIEAQMLAIARSMQKAIRKALGIRSPSRVMQALGAFIGRGLVVGISGQGPAVDAAMRRLVAVPAAPDFGSAAPGASGGIRGGGASVHVSYNAPTPEDPGRAAMELSRRLLAAVAV